MIPWLPMWIATLIPRKCLLRICVSNISVEDNQIPIDGETAEAYTNICFVLECGRPHGYDPNLDWALRVMSSTLDQPALQVKALVTAIEQAKAANPASVALVS